MPEQPMGHDWHDERRGDTVAPSNPPNAVVNRHARRTALWTYLGIIAGFFVVVGAAFLFWVGTGAGPLDDDNRFDPSAVGTSGERLPREGTPGGFDPTPAHGNTESELEFRGAGEPAQGPMPALNALGDSSAASAGRTIDLRDVEVERAEGNTFWIRDGNRRASVTTAGDAPTVREGQRVDITGTIEAGGDEPRIRANRVEVK
jgi:hypothetical protein